MPKQNIPQFIIDSAVFSPAELESLASVDALPEEQQIDAFRYEPEIQELLNAFIGDDSTRLTHQLLKAKEFLNQDEVENAWKIILL